MITHVLKYSKDREEDRDMYRRGMIFTAMASIGAMGAVGLPSGFGRPVIPAMGTNGTPYKPESGTDKPTHSPYVVQMTKTNLKRQSKGLKPKH